MFNVGAPVNKPACDPAVGAVGAIAAVPPIPAVPAAAAVVAIGAVTEQEHYVLRQYGAVYAATPADPSIHIWCPRRTSS